MQTIDTARARREALRWLILLTLNNARPLGAMEGLVLSVAQSEYPDATPLELRRELDYLHGRELVRLQKRPDARWHAELTRHGVQVGMETNGTLALPDGLDWITVSPKAGTELAVTRGNELKLVWPQEGIDLQDFEQLEFEHFFLQPRDSADQAQATEEAVQTCLKRPLWKLSLQTHKYIGIR